MMMMVIVNINIQYVVAEGSGWCI